MKSLSSTKFATIRKMKFGYGKRIKDAKVALAGSWKSLPKQPYVIDIKTTELNEPNIPLKKSNEVAYDFMI